LSGVQKNHRSSGGYSGGRVSILEEESGEENHKEDDEDVTDQREICQVTDVTEEDMETTEDETLEETTEVDLDETPKL
jgi:hypothetical protein